MYVLIAGRVLVLGAAANTWWRIFLESNAAAPHYVCPPRLGPRRCLRRKHVVEEESACGVSHSSYDALRRRMGDPLNAFPRLQHLALLSKSLAGRVREYVPGIRAREKRMRAFTIHDSLVRLSVTSPVNSAAGGEACGPEDGLAFVSFFRGEIFHENVQHQLVSRPILAPTAEPNTSNVPDVVTNAPRHRGVERRWRRRRDTSRTKKAAQKVPTTTPSSVPALTGRTLFYARLFKKVKSCAKSPRIHSPKVRQDRRR